MKNIFKLYPLITILIAFQPLNPINKGLEWGANSCYFDASIQALSQLEEFNSEIGKYQFDEMTNSKIYLNLINKIKNNWEEKQQFVARKDPLIGHITLENFHLGWTQKLEELAYRKEPKKRNLTRQEDANEFIINFFISVDKEIDDYRKKIKQDIIKEFKLEDALAEAQAIGKIQALGLTNPFNLIEGQTKSISKCQICKTEKAYPAATFRTLLLIIPKKENLSLQDCLENFAKEEVSAPEEKRFCAVCKNNQPFTEATKLNATSKYLIIQLNRFDFDYTASKAVKIGKSIKFPTKLIFDKNCSFLDEDMKIRIGESKIIYNLLAFIVHGGESANSGHYWAYGKDKDNEWYLYNDAKVSPAGNSKHLKASDPLRKVLRSGLDNNVSGYKNATPYILFYELAPDGQDEPEFGPDPLQENLIDLQLQLQELKTKLLTLQNKLKNLKAKITAKSIAPKKQAPIQPKGRRQSKRKK